MKNYHEDFIKISRKLSFTEEEMIELYSCIEEILSHEKWECMRMYKHHLDTRSIHSLEVCCIAWRKAKKGKRMSTRDIAVGALLHDFFLYDWQNEKACCDFFEPKRLSIKLHGFIHPVIAYHNALKYFPHLINEKVKDIIVKHMWPLTVKPPRFDESWTVCMIDKSCSLDVFKSPRELPHYLGIKKRVNNR